MVQVMQMLGCGLTALASLAAIFMFFMGGYALITGKITLCADRLRGGSARMAGVMLIVVLPICAAIVALFGGPWGVNWRESPEKILIPILGLGVVLIGIVAVLRYARRTALSPNGG